MPGSRRRRSRFWLSPLLLLSVSSIPVLLPAQATRDQPILTLGLAGGKVLGAHDFWHVPNQPIQAPAGAFDIFDLSRQLTGNVSLALQAALFPKPNLGYTAEITYLGIGTRDRCIRAQATDYEFNQLVCTALNRDVRSTSATAMLVGAVVRPYSRSLIQPYLKLQVGAAVISNNLTAMTAFIGPGQQVVQPIYPTPGTMALHPTASASFGLLANAGTGYVVRIEARNNWLVLNRVAGASAHERITPPTQKALHSFPALLIGLDVVLEKSRGRRY